MADTLYHADSLPSPPHPLLKNDTKIRSCRDEATSKSTFYVMIEITSQVRKFGPGKGTIIRQNRKREKNRKQMETELKNTSDFCIELETNALFLIIQKYYDEYVNTSFRAEGITFKINVRGNYINCFIFLAGLPASVFILES